MLPEHGDHIGELDESVEHDPILGEVLPPALLAVNEDDGVGDLEAGVAERRRGFEDGGAAGNKVLYDEAGLAGLEVALDGLGGAVGFDLLAAHEHGDGVSDGSDGGNGKGGVGDAAEEVVGAGNGGD